jgi:hypothetical protein
VVAVAVVVMAQIKMVLLAVLVAVADRFLVQEVQELQIKDTQAVFQAPLMTEMVAAVVALEVRGVMLVRQMVGPVVQEFPLR